MEPLRSLDGAFEASNRAAERQAVADILAKIERYAEEFPNIQVITE